MMTFETPIWFLLVIPIAVSLWLWRPPTRLLLGLRIAAMLLILIAMCGPAIFLPSRAGIVVVVVDRSLSMPPGAAAAQKEVIDLIQNTMGDDDRIAVVSFGHDVVIERPARAGKFADFTSKIDPDGSNLAEAVNMAVSLIPRETSGRILLLSDGLWSGRNPVAAARRSALSGIPVDFRPQRRTSANDLAIDRIDAPPQVTPGESYTLTAWIRSPRVQEAEFELMRGNLRLAGGSRTLAMGLNRLTFRDIAGKSGTLRYSLRVTGSQKDSVPENNEARLLLGIRGPKPILCVSPGKTSALVELLRAGNLNVLPMRPQQCKWSLEDLSEYSAVLLEDVPAQWIPAQSMETLAKWVTRTGAGLMMTGGRNSYGPGGYFRSPLEPIMPVSMELRREHRKLAIAIVIALDRSGSMTAPVGGGKTKMDLANIASAQVLDLLTSNDELGVLAVDSAPHIIHPLGRIKDKSSMRGKILRIESMGGGIFVYEALSKAAAMLAKAKAGTRHIILFADAADAEEPGKYKELLKKCRAAGMTCSVIGLGKKADCDANLLRDVAKRGGGRCFFTENPKELPRLFAQDTFVVARSTFLDETTAVRFTPAMRSISGKAMGKPPKIGGYNLCYLRPGANPAAVTIDEYKAPLLAAWQAGIGRVLCYTGQADGKFTGQMARWKNVGHFFTSQARWTAGAFDQLPDNMLVTQEVKSGHCLVQLHLDPKRQAEPFRTIPSVSILHGLRGESPKADQVQMRWASPDMLQAFVPIHGSETVIATVDAGPCGRVSLPPLCRPYSPEFRPVDSSRGLKTLEQLSATTGGTQRVDLAGIWKDLPEMPRDIPVAHWLLPAAIVLLVLEILQRRTGLLTLGASSLRRGVSSVNFSFRKRSRSQKRPVKTDKPEAAPIDKKRPVVAESKPPSMPMPEESAKTPPPESKADENVLDAIRKAKRVAKRRTNR